jgi:hypothetical protein
MLRKKLYGLRVGDWFAVVCVILALYHAFRGEGSLAYDLAIVSLGIVLLTKRK